jgi:hypothetical protein
MKSHKSHFGTPVEHRKARSEDGHRKDTTPPTPKPQPNDTETAEAAQARRNRSGGSK